MNVSEKGRKLIASWEGLRTHMYLDAAKLPTIGVGHLLTQSERSSGKLVVRGETLRWEAGLTEQQCLDLLDQDLDPAERAVNDGVTVPLLQHQFDALVSFTFNSGARAFRDSTLLKLLNQQQYDQVPTQLRRWVRCAGNVVQGLVNRREHEIELWEGRV